MTSAMLLPYLIVFGIGYLLGSIPFGLLLTRAAGLGDVRQIGSGNIGATNVLRTGNKKLAALTLFLDGFKGYLAVVLVGALVAPLLVPAVAGSSGAPSTGSSITPLDPAIAALHARLAQTWALMTGAGIGAFLGHIYPVWLGFKGGKGVATYIGVLLGLAWIPGLIFCGIWLAVAAVFRYSSLAALVAAGATPILFWWVGNPRLAMAFLMMTVLLFWKHHENISRLAQGTESKIGAKSAKAEPA
jgi:glycerol-3-phosphate acyltransferase PlsY